MKTINIYTYSGTFQTLQITSSIARKLKDKEIYCKIIEVNKNTKYEDSDIIGIAFPIIYYQAPQTIIDFINLLPTTDKPYIILSTFKFSKWKNNGASYEIKNLMAKKGFHLIDEFLIQTHLDSSLDSINANDAYFDKIVDVVSQISFSNVKNNYLPYLFNRPYIKKIKRQNRKIQFVIDTNSCNKCNFCINLCPENNITNDGKAILIGNECTLCMRCRYICPNNAISLNVEKKSFTPYKYNSTTYKSITQQQYQDLYLADNVKKYYQNDYFLSYVATYTNVDLYYGYYRFREPNMSDKIEHNFILLDSLDKGIVDLIYQDYLHHDASYLHFRTQVIDEDVFSPLGDYEVTKYCHLQAPISNLMQINGRSDVKIRRLNKNDLSLFNCYKFIDDYHCGANYAKRNAERCGNVGLVNHLTDYYMIFQDNEAIGLLGVHLCKNTALITEISILDTLQRNLFGSSFIKELFALLKDNDINRVFAVLPVENEALHFFEKLGFCCFDHSYSIIKKLK